jgi:hypothetical protein
MRRLMWVRKLPGTSTKNANGGVSTAEPEKRESYRPKSGGVTRNVNAIQWERLHDSAEYIPEGKVLRGDDQVPAHRTTKYPK